MTKKTAIDISDIDYPKIVYHPERVSEWLSTGNAFPIYLEIGPTDYCNHRCIFCALDFLDDNKSLPLVSDNRSVTYIDRDALLRNLEDMGNNGVKSLMFAGEGEPLAHKHIGLFTKKAYDSGIDVSITTNGALLNQKKIEGCLPYLKWIRFSVDSGDKENYFSVHRPKKPDDFDNVINNISNAVNYRNSNNLSTTIGIQALVLNTSIDHVEELTKIAKSIGVDNIQIKPYSHHPLSRNDFTLEPGTYEDLEQKLMKYDSENFRVLFRKQTINRVNSKRSYTECLALPFITLIDCKGNIMPCNLFYDKPEFHYGNINDNLFSEIWKSDKFKAVLENVKEKGISECRQSCRLDPSNCYLDRLKNPKSHDNFI